MHEDIVYQDPSVVSTQALAASFVGSLAFSTFFSISPLVRRIIKDKKAKSAQSERLK